MLIVKFTEDGEEGYPGNLNAFAKYSLSATSGDVRCQTSITIFLDECYKKLDRFTKEA